MPHPFVTMKATTMKPRGCNFCFSQFLSDLNFNVDDLFQAPGWRKVSYERLQKKATMMNKSENGMNPEYRRSSSVFRGVTSIRFRNIFKKQTSTSINPQ